MLKASAVTIGRPPSHPFHFLKRMQGYILSDDIALKIVTHLDLCTILSLSRVSALVTALVNSDAEPSIPNHTLRRAKACVGSVSPLCRSGSMLRMHTNSRSLSQLYVTTTRPKRSATWRG